MSKLSLIRLWAMMTFLGNDDFESYEDGFLEDDLLEGDFTEDSFLEEDFSIQDQED